jgi:hypothetical protein
MHKSNQRSKGLHYLVGGNPPVVAGLFLNGERIAWLPAGMTPTQNEASLILTAYEALGHVLSREDVRAVFESRNYE